MNYESSILERLIDLIDDLRGDAFQAALQGDPMPSEMSDATVAELDALLVEAAHELSFEKVG